MFARSLAKTPAIKQARAFQKGQRSSLSCVVFTLLTRLSGSVLLRGGCVKFGRRKRANHFFRFKSSTAIRLLSAKPAFWSPHMHDSGDVRQTRDQKHYSSTQVQTQSSVNRSQQEIHCRAGTRHVLPIPLWSHHAAFSRSLHKLQHVIFFPKETIVSWSSFR